MQVFVLKSLSFTQKSPGLENTCENNCITPPDQIGFLTEHRQHGLSQKKLIKKRAPISRLVIWSHLEEVAKKDYVQRVVVFPIVGLLYCLFSIICPF